jgi:hypothetical protein
MQPRRDARLIVFLCFCNVVYGREVSAGFNAKKIDKTRIIAIGGLGLSSVEMYESKIGRWTKLPDMRRTRGGAAACIVGSKVIVTGGWNDGYLNTCEYLDLAAEGNKKWVVIPSTMQEARGGCSGVVLDDGVTFLVSGGVNDDDDDDALSSCEQLDTVTMTWSDVPSMDSARSNHCTVLYKSKAVVIGGLDATSDDLALCEEYDAANETWSAFPCLTSTRYWHGACVLDDRIFVCGGYVDGSASDSVEVFDGVRWHVLDSSLSSPRWDPLCVVWEGKVVVLGGDGDKSQDVEVFDEVEKRWRSNIIPPLTMKRRELCAISF